MVLARMARARGSWEAGFGSSIERAILGGRHARRGRGPRGDSRPRISWSFHGYPQARRAAAYPVSGASVCTVVRMRVDCRSRSLRTTVRAMEPDEARDQASTPEKRA